MRVPALTWRHVGAVAALLLAAQVAALWLLGQPLWCECGVVSVWAGDPLSPENSQQLSDWYTLSHVLHGFVFYLAFWLLFPRVPVRVRLLAALGLEVGWEMVENSPWLIEHYRQQALAAGYTGDSILNSVTDTVAMVVGFVLARKLPLWASIALALGLEALPLIFIRDSLILNAANLLYPFDFLRAWQGSGH